MQMDDFEEVSWEDLGDTMQRKPKMYQLWLGKQGSGYCGTGEMLARRDDNADSRSPNCACVEDTAHLCRCQDKDRRQALRKWMEDHHTHPELAHWIPLYVLKQGFLKLVDIEHAGRYHQRICLRQCGKLPTRRTRSAGRWAHLLEGKVSMSIRRLQRFFLVSCDMEITIETGCAAS